jgi:SWI/SNF related-matrix-associated actin-dependent regulator of chromatin subfamily C
LNALFASHAALSKHGLSVKFDCNACGADLKVNGVFYHAFCARDFDLCPSCFSKGVYAHGQASGDFVKALYPDFNAADVAEDEIADDVEWTPQEVSALLDAISKSNELNWSDIAAVVGTKSEDECLKYFARMPIEDAALESMERELFVPRGAIVDDVGAKIVDPVPFAFAPNPIMAQLEFLVSVVSPRVAAAAAKAALTKIARDGSIAADGLNVDGLTAAAVQAKILAQDEEHEVRRIVASALDVLLKKLQVKLGFLSRLADDAPAAARLVKLRADVSSNRINDLRTRDAQSARHKEHIATIHRLRERLAAPSL